MSRWQDHRCSGDSGRSWASSAFVGFDEAESEASGVGEANVVNHFDQERSQSSRACSDCSRGLERDGARGSRLEGVVGGSREEVSGEAAEVG